jgi:CheY-like chemotaxis protein
MDTVTERDRILVVDDHDGMRVLLGVMLHRMGYEPVAVGDGSEALDELEAGPYAAVLADWQMPDVDGLTLLRRLRARGDRIPFVLMSAALPDEVARSALWAGADLALEKSEVVESLPRVLERVLSARWTRSAGSPARRPRRRPSPSLAC